MLHFLGESKQKETMDEWNLFIDLGTNAELVLFGKDRGICCATAAGPAFDGDAGTGFFGSDMIAVLAGLLEKGIVDEMGTLNDAYFEKGIETVKVYFEKPVYGGFYSAECYLPNYEWKNIEGFSQEEISTFHEYLQSVSHIIIRLAREGGFDNAANL